MPGSRREARLRIARRAVTAVALALVELLPAHAGAADDKTKVTIVSVGPKRFRVRIAAGQGLPCDSMANEKLFEGLLQPGDTVSLQSPNGVVCVQQTYEDWPDVGWSFGFLAWGTCFGFGGRKDGPWCRKGDGSIHVTLRSSAPKK